MSHGNRWRKHVDLLKQKLQGFSSECYLKEIKSIFAVDDVRAWHSLTTAEWISLSSSSFYLLFCLILIQFLIKTLFLMLRIKFRWLYCILPMKRVISHLPPTWANLHKSKKIIIIISGIMIKLWTIYSIIHLIILQAGKIKLNELEINPRSQWPASTK